MSNHPMPTERDFMSLVLSGEVMADEIDDFIDSWHAEQPDMSLHAYLGMTKDEYGLWLTSPEYLNLIIASRKLGRPLSDVANDNLQRMRLAAGAEDSKLVKQLEAWLRQCHAG